MSSLTTFPTKQATDILFLPFDFISQLEAGETVVSALVTATVILGIDPLPGDLIVGVATIVNQAVIQKIEGGLVGVLYNLSCSIVTSNGNTLIMQGKLAVVDTNPFEVSV